MAVINPFKCIRPNYEVVNKVAALPYDVYNTEEARIQVQEEPLSFLKIDRAETNFDEDIEIYDNKVYKKAREIFDAMIEDGTFITDDRECYYIYQLIMEGRSQTGIVACASIDDYTNNVIKKHENTRQEKEQDRIKHVDILDAQTGPIFLAYRSNQIINQIVDEIKEQKPLYSFTAKDNISHNIWVIDKEEKITLIKEAFDTINNIYIADGHHRAASAVKVALKRRNENLDYNGKEAFNYFLSVLFPNDQLMIMPYNRAVKDLNGLSKEEFISKIEDKFHVECLGKEAYSPSEKATFGMYLKDNWYKLKAKEELIQIKDPVKGLDVSLLQDYILSPVLGVKDPRIDNRIDFVGGIRGLKELEKRVDEDMTVAFSMYPTSINELFTVSDAEKLMPPKSTWFEPKLRSGIFIHKLS